MFLSILVGLAIPIGIIALIVYLVRKKDHQPQEEPSMLWKRFAVAAAIALVIPFFIAFATSAVFNELESVNSFITMMVLSFLFLVAGLVISRHTVISGGSTIGSVVAIIYAIMVNFETISPQAMAIVAGLGLAVFIAIAYKRLQDKEGM